MIVLPRLYQIAVISVMVLAPTVLVGYLYQFQSPPLIYKDFFFHELVVFVAVAISAFVTYVSYLCYRTGKESVMFFLTLAFLAFTLIYAPHGFLTRTAIYHPPLFLLFGPMSRLGMSLFFAIAMTRILDKRNSGESPLTWWPWISLIGFLLVLEPIHAYLSGPLLHPVRYGMELCSIILFSFGLYKLTKLYRSSALYLFILVSVTLFIQSCVVFIISKPFEHVWWLAHLIFASGFMILGYGIVQIYRGTGSFSHVFIDNQSLERISKIRVQTMSSLSELLDKLPLVVMEWTGSNTLDEKLAFINTYGRDLTSDARTLTNAPSLMEWINAAVDAEDLERVRNYFESDLNDNSSIEFRSSKDDLNKHRAILLTLSVGNDWLGNPVWRAVGIDITDLKHSEEERLHLQKRLAKSARMQALSQLSGGLSHEINNMLVPILMGIDITLLKLDDDHESKTSLEKAKNGTIRIKELVDRVLAVARDTEDHTDGVLVDQTINESVEAFRSSVGKGVEFTINLNNPEAEWPCRRIELWQILANLLSNSVDALPANGGKINISGEKTNSNDVDGYRVTVADNGKGINPDLLDRVTDPFYTTKDVGKGTGLGLSMVRQIIDGYNGSINISSEVDKYTSIEVFMPCSEN